MQVKQRLCFKYLKDGIKEKNAKLVRTAAGLLNIPANITETPQKCQL